MADVPILRIWNPETGRYEGVSQIKGDDGRGITSVSYDETNDEWVIAYTDGTTDRLGASSSKKYPYISEINISGSSVEVVTVTAKDETDVQTFSIPSKLSDLKGDTTHRTVTDTQIDTWNSKSSFSGSFKDLSDLPSKIVKEINFTTYDGLWIYYADGSSAHFPQDNISAHSHTADKISGGILGGQVAANSLHQSPGEYLVRNQKLSATDDEPTVEGEICWIYS